MVKNIGLETVFALATAPGRGGVALFRISGPAAGSAAIALSGRVAPEARRAVLRRLSDPITGAEIDRALVLYFASPQSVTGEDVLELHVHGGRAVTEAVTNALAALPGFRPAEPGEFTRRAFENGKLDLTGAEAIADLVAAETAAQHRQALRQMAGELGRLYDDWAHRLTRGLAHLEADIDFPEEDLPDQVSVGVLQVIATIWAEISAHLADNRRGERLREGLSIAIIGPPNAGKSSLMNALARRDVVIVSARAGTTRDVVEAHLDLGGYPVVVADTAGLREAADEIEAEGIRRARERAAAADLKIAVLDATAGPAGWAEMMDLVDADTLVVINKTDLAEPALPAISGARAIPVSAVTGQGIPALLEELQRAVADRLGGGGGPTLTRARHRSALEECLGSLQRASAAELPELIAEDVRLAVRALGRITGKVDVEDLLEVIFRDFCIGK